ncbi:MAG: hypothetical protein CGW95_08855 [Phenylobacterium zucineum]|nr:MAG: hypothetical protein CGW95_08855 [Phenylobacterium zucineum]
MSVTSPIAGRVDIHQTVMVDGIMSMQQIQTGIVLPPGKSVIFEPGGKHLMLLGLKSALKSGNTFPLTFRLGSGKQITLMAEVRVSPPPVDSK